MSTATGLISIRIDVSANGFFILFAFSQRLHQSLGKIQKPVMCAVIVFVTCYMIVAGIQILLIIDIDIPKIFIIGVPIIFSSSLTISIYEQLS